MTEIFESASQALLYGVVGLAVMAVGFVALDLVTPASSSTWCGGTATRGGRAAGQPVRRGGSGHHGGHPGERVGTGLGQGLLSTLLYGLAGVLVMTLRRHRDRHAHTGSDGRDRAGGRRQPPAPRRLGPGPACTWAPPSWSARPSPRTPPMSSTHSGRPRHRGRSLPPPGNPHLPGGAVSSAALRLPLCRLRPRLRTRADRAGQLPHRQLGTADLRGHLRDGVRHGRGLTGREAAAPPRGRRVRGTGRGTGTDRRPVRPGAVRRLRLAAAVHAREIVVSLVVGLLIGAEIPLLMTLLQRIRRQEASSAVADMFAVDYIGALVGGLCFPLLLLPTFGQLKGALVVGVVRRGRRRHRRGLHLPPRAPAHGTGRPAGRCRRRARRARHDVRAGR
ncbi:hypothetical protein LV779_34805 [Streptomyces thinghirensis]|nr:hypothetical protein [Streptomyces thinghirensis]